MESWAQRHGDVVRFLCVCVDALGVAKMFDRMFRFEHVLNAYIPSRDYFPEGYGQLGCSGFIVADENGNFISRKTKAYLDVGEEAFLDVERLLAKYIHKPSTSRDTFAAGAPVEQDSSVLAPPTGIHSIDREHEVCAAALQALCERPSISNLKVVLEELEAHFTHEEVLLKKHGFGGEGPFSALASHTKDHQRILDLCVAELERQQQSCFDGA